RTALDASRTPRTFEPAGSMATNLYFGTAPRSRSVVLRDVHGPDDLGDRRDVLFDGTQSLVLERAHPLFGGGPAHLVVRGLPEDELLDPFAHVEELVDPDPVDVAGVGA